MVRLAARASLFLVLFTAYAASPVRTSADSRWSIHTAMSVLRGQGGRLGEYAPAIAAEHGYAIFYRHGDPYTMFPIGTSLLAAPFVWAAQAASPGLNGYLTEHIPARFEGVLASLFGAIAGCLFHALITARFGDRRVSAAITAVFCFGTSMWSVATRALWQHGPLVLMLTAAMLILVSARRKPSLIAYLGLPLAAAFVIRPTAAIPIAVLSLYVLLCYRRWFLFYAAGAAVLAIPWLAFNAISVQAVLPFYYLPGRLSGGSAGEALLGNLVSPGRGLFVFSPVLLFAFPGFVLAMRERFDRPLHAAFATIVLLHWLAVSRFPHWWGGFCFGPRLMSDILPFAAYFVAFAMRTALAAPPAWPRRLTLSAMSALAAASTAIHAQGALTWAPYLWSVQPVSLDQHPQRLWDWSDPQFARALRITAPMPDFGPWLPGLATPCRLGPSGRLGLNFGNNWRPPDCRQSGWSQHEPWGMWSDGPQASLDIVIPAGWAPTLDLELAADTRGLLSSRQATDDVDVLVNGVAVARWHFDLTDQAGERRALISAALISAGLARAQASIRIDFRPEAPRSPAELGLSADRRRLGIGLSKLTIRPAR